MYPSVSTLNQAGECVPCSRTQVRKYLARAAVWPTDPCSTDRCEQQGSFCSRQPSPSLHIQTHWSIQVTQATAPSLAPFSYWQTIRNLSTSRIPRSAKMAGAGYDAVVDMDDSGQGDLGHTDLQDDLEFHNSNFTETNASNRKAPGGSSLPLPATASSGGKRFLWSINFYAQFFDVDTSAVLQRCWAALFPRANFLDVLEGNPDLYGPFWIATTVVFILFLGGTISKYLATTGVEPFVYDFKLLSGTYTHGRPSL